MEQFIQIACLAHLYTLAAANNHKSFIRANRKSNNKHKNVFDSARNRRQWNDLNSQRGPQKYNIYLCHNDDVVSVDFTCLIILKFDIKLKQKPNTNFNLEIVKITKTPKKRDVF